MLVVMSNTATQEQIDAVVGLIEKKGYTAKPIPGGDRVSIGVLYNKGSVDASLSRCFPVSRKWSPLPGPTNRSAGSSSRRIPLSGLVISPSAGMIW